MLRGRKSAKCCSTLEPTAALPTALMITKQTLSHSMVLTTSMVLGKVFVFRAKVLWPGHSKLRRARTATLWSHATTFQAVTLASCRPRPFWDTTPKKRSAWTIETLGSPVTSTTHQSPSRTALNHIYLSPQAHYDLTSYTWVSISWHVPSVGCWKHFD